ncbi:MAG: hypothetical protein ACE5J3_05205 [Methanosarcinales archaeon]
MKKLISPKKEELYILKPAESIPELMKQIEDSLKEENAYLKSEVLRLQKIVKEYKKKLKPKVEEETKKIRADVLKKAKALKKAKELRKIRFKIEGKQPIFLTRSRRTMGLFNKLYGIELHQTDGGEIVFIPLLTNGKEHRRLQQGVLSFRDMFYEKANIVNQIKSGVVHSSFDIADGRLIVVQTNPNIKDTDRYQYEKKIAELNEKIDEMKSKLYDTIKRERKLIEEKQEIELAKGVEEYSTEYSKGVLKSALDKVKGLVSEYGKMMLANQDAELNRVLTEQFNKTLRRSVDKLLTELEVKLPKEVREIVREQLKKDFAELSEIAEKRLTPQVSPPSPPKVEKK